MASLEMCSPIIPPGVLPFVGILSNSPDTPGETAFEKKDEKNGESTPRT